MTLDLQVNGFAGVDFNSGTLTPETLHHACAQVVAHGADQILATLITDDLDRLVARLQQLVALREHDPLVRQVIAGIHVEGPFISPEPGYVGAHPPEHVRPATPESAQRLHEAAGGLLRLMTLAPEHDVGLRTTSWLASQGVTVACGHSDAALDVLRAALDAGLTMATHVGNGCPMQLARHDNIIIRQLALADRLWCCFIADGAHMPWSALGVYLRAVGPDRAIIVTDAIAAASLGPGRYRLGQREIDIGADGIAWGPGRAHLVGSTATIRSSVTALRTHLGLTDEMIHRLISVHPRQAVEV